MVDQIFISHSSKDIDIINFFLEKFSGSGIKPILMEYEKGENNRKLTANYIIEEIQRSKAVFVILTQNITKYEHTQNWVAFEIGVAAARRPQIPVIVFREQEVNFPVPFLTHYFSQPLTRNNQLIIEKHSMSASQPSSSTLQLNFILGKLYESIIDFIIKGDPKSLISMELHNQCPYCLLKFQYYGWSDKDKDDDIKCPCCYQLIKTKLK